MGGEVGGGHRCSTEPGGQRLKPSGKVHRRPDAGEPTGGADISIEQLADMQSEAVAGRVMAAESGQPSIAATAARISPAAFSATPHTV
jgi:hypothetical protein